MWVICFKRAIIGFAIGNLSLTFTSIHSDFNNDIMVDVVIVCLTQLLSTFLFSFIILGLMGNFSQETRPGGLPVQIQGIIKNITDQSNYFKCHSIDFRLYDINFMAGTGNIVSA